MPERTERKIDEPAFPVLAPIYRNGDEIYSPTPGLSMRDYFAAHALAGLAGSWVKENHEIIAQVAHDAYQIADAMLKARKAGR